LFSFVANAQTKTDKIKQIKFYVDSVKMCMREGLHSHIMGGKRHSEYPVLITYYHCPDTTQPFGLGETVMEETLAWNEKRQRIERRYFFINDEFCFFDEKRINQNESIDGAEPWLEVYIYDGEILDYNIYGISKKLSEKEIKKIIKKGSLTMGPRAKDINKW
jgi:hypothetical protein